MSGIFDKLSDKLEDDAALDAPKVGSFMQFLTEHAKVKVPGGRYVEYSFVGREALIPIVETFDLVLGSHTGRPLPDATIDVCGGAQFGKTILALNFGAYCTACKFYNWGLYLPDDDLVEGIVDTKLRPDVIEQVDWLDGLMSLGVTEEKKSGRTKRSVNRKGAFQMSDGVRKAFGMIRGMGKIPTSFSADVIMEDEKDDIDAKRSKYLTGRMTSSDLRLRSSIGTQRLHGAGQNKQWKDGSQGVFEFKVGDRQINLEENWPAVCRLAVNGSPRKDDPKLTLSAVFRRDGDDGGQTWKHHPKNVYYFADPETGIPVDRTKPIEVHRRPERIEQYGWSFRLSQFIFDALSITQFVSRWTAAVADPDMMVVFCCDVKAMPDNAVQAITPDIIKRAQTTGEAFDLSLSKGAHPKFAGLDTGKRCWLYAREAVSDREKRTVWAEDIPLSLMVSRTETLFHKLGIGCLFIDANPATQEARTLCYKLNQLEGKPFPQLPDPDNAYIKFAGGLVWNGKKSRWENLRCAVVEFTRKPGAGVIHKLGRDDHGTEVRYYPIIQCNRYEAIDRVVKEFLTPAENVVHVVGDEILEDPLMRLPRKELGSPPIVETLENHLIAGSARQEKPDGEEGDYVDKCENHLLLANAYSRLAEMNGEAGLVSAPVTAETFKLKRARKYD